MRGLCAGTRRGECDIDTLLLITANTSFLSLSRSLSLLFIVDHLLGDTEFRPSPRLLR